MSEEQKKEIKKKDIVIPMDLLMLTNLKTPDNLRTWESFDEQSPEYQEMTLELDAITTFIANQLNEGPELKENMGKRVMTFKAVLRTLIKKVFMSNIDRVGVLSQLIFDLQYESEMRKLASAYQKQAEEEAKKRASYVG
jgi:hypothetical protein